MATTPTPGAPKRPFAGLESTTTPERDLYYGHEPLATLTARFITHLFACPDVPPASTPNASHAQAKLPYFIAYALHRTKLGPEVTFAALILLQRLKRRFPTARGSCGHRLFISAYMIASKVICDDTYSNKSWCIVAQGMFKLREINQMEREMCSYLDWELTVDGPMLSRFEKAVRKDFGEDVDRQAYPSYPLSFVSKRAMPTKKTKSGTGENKVDPDDGKPTDSDTPRPPTPPNASARNSNEDSNDSDDSDSDSDASRATSLDVRMFSNARDFSIQDTTINNAGGDITIHHHHHQHNHFHQGSSPTFLSWRNPGSAMFHLAAQTIKKLLPLGFSPPSEIDLKETAAEDMLKYPRLSGVHVKVVESKTTMCLPGSLLQTLASIRYSFF